MPGACAKGKISTPDPKQKNLLAFFKKTDTPPTSLSPPAKRAKLEEGIEKEENKTKPEQGSLTPEQKKLVNQKAMAARCLRHSQTLKILDPQMGPSWYSALESEFKKDYFLKLNDFVVEGRNRTTIYPKAANVWKWTKHCKVEDSKVVILGQDPYHGPNQAHGLCFSVPKGVTPPPSLMNMYKELGNDIEGFKYPNHGYLVGWAQQGVLLLNSVLTVEAGKANSHKDKGWEQMTDAVISWISKNLNSVVFLFWGSYAQKKAAFVDKKKHHLLQAVHPSPLSAHRGFFGCKHFSKCNELLTKSGKAPIDWKHLP